MHPIRDKRYTLTQEYCGQDGPRWVARFCGEWIDQGVSRSHMVLRCVGHSAIRNGAMIIEALEA